MAKTTVSLRRLFRISNPLLGSSRGCNLLKQSKLAANSVGFNVCIVRSNARACSTNNIVQPFFDNVDIPSNMSLPQFLWEGAVKNHGNKIALVDDISGKEYTYIEAFSASKKFGTAVRRLGLKKGDVVAFFLHNCPEYITSLTGVIGVGGIATTVNPNYTATEVTRQLGMANVKMILTTSELVLVAHQAVKKTKQKIEIIVLDSKVFSFSTLAYHDIMQGDELFPDSDNKEFSKEDVVILPYSSGTTGLPKGMMNNISGFMLLLCIHLF